ncbi:alpha/beta fold hydrolase [Kitasatospora atroaurantiaca]|uniref:Surfactin synthase thioesterase subunit n=1 Tax=Kitasatospora atroaurantiaca TaxID=285545 RepID=A0A561ET78_9ACTN|nr:alpha/beta fold hydrolase [Kitasatospora atroaurantiaca]TWE18810.1 surfactin synthase thioesterase subunit [Kitasatospora atroaurantiaca]
MKLFLLPPAGASAGVFRAWPEALRTRTGLPVDMVAVELPGRGGRLAEPLATSLPALVDELFLEHTPERGVPWAVVGHSMGALLGAAWAARAAADGRGPQFLVVSASVPPWLHSTAADLAGPDEELWGRVDALGGLPAVIRENPVARRLFGRVLQADITAAARYRPAGPAPVGCPVVAVRGAEDPLVDASLVGGWSELTDRGFRELVLGGGHFYRGGVDDLIPVVADQLARSDVSKLQPVGSLVPSGSRPPGPARGQGGVPTNSHGKAGR